MSKVFIIAEAGVNHNGSDKLAFDLIDAAIEAGVDAVKFQTFKADNIVTKDASLAEYQIDSDIGVISQYDMLKKLELSYESHFRLKQYCDDKNIIFLSTAFDNESLDFLVNNLKLSTLKIPSGEITNGPFLLAHARSRKKLIISTGMTDMDEIEQALSVIAFGLVKKNKKPSYDLFKSIYKSDEGKQALKENVTLLHCTSEYPAKYKDLNLNAIYSLKKKFGLDVGYSDHSKGIIVPIVAATMGAKIIEKHFTLSKNLPGPDHKASIEPTELKEMVDKIRSVAEIMGGDEKVAASSELANRDIVRKSLIAATQINKGDIFTNENIAIKRAGKGKSPMDYWKLIGKKSSKTFFPGDLIN